MTTHNDTSDSEAFESADEDFDNDHSIETSTSEQVSISSNIVQPSKTTDLFKKSEDKEINKKDTNVDETGNTEASDKYNPNSNLISLEETKSKSKNECSEPPRMVACWEPGADNLAASDLVNKCNEERRKTKERNDNLDNASWDNKIDNWSTSESAEMNACWKSDVDNWTVSESSKNKTDETKPENWSPHSEFSEPPEMVACWEPDADNWTASEYVKKHNEKSRKEKSQTSEEQSVNVTNKEVTGKAGREEEIDDLNAPEGKPCTGEILDTETATEYVQEYSNVMQSQKSKFSYDSKDDDFDNWGDNFDDWGDNDEKGEKDEKSQNADDWNDDSENWEPIEKTNSYKQQATSLLDKLSIQNEKERKENSWGKWDGWGMSSILSSATGSVQTFTNHVTQGLTTVLETGIGAPSPEELALLQKSEREKREVPELEQEPSENENAGSFGFGNLLSGVTKLVETTGSKVVNTGLDTLEVIGKKTMEVLQEGDPGLVKKKAMLGLNSDKPILSQILREAKERNDIEDREAEKKKNGKKVHFETLFDDHHGLVHLEALEMLSKQCTIKLNSLLESHTGDELNELQETMLQVKELCELPDEEEDEHNDIQSMTAKLESAVTDIGINISYDKLISVWFDAEAKLPGVADPAEVHEKAIETLAQITSAAVEQFHKTAELLLVKERRSTADEADSLVQMASTLSALIGIVAARFSEKLDSLGSQTDNPELNSLITNVFFEATNSSTYIQDAFQLLIPILQAGAV